jgi:hypothetical protein
LLNLFLPRAVQSFLMSDNLVSDEKELLERAVISAGGYPGFDSRKQRVQLLCTIRPCGKLPDDFIGSLLAYP